MSTATRTRTDPRISRRRRAIARSKRRRSAASLAAVGLTAAAVWAAFWSPLLDVDRVMVVGSRHVTSEEVAHVAELDNTDNLLLLSTAEIEKQIESLPWVKQAKVDRRLPGTVRVKVTERRPRIVLVLRDGRWLLDRGGNVLAPSSQSDTKLPVLAGATVTGVEPGLTVRDDEVQDALRAWISLEPRLRERVVGVIAPTPERITLSLDDGTQIRFGAAQALRAKNKVLEALLAQLRAEGTKAGYIDVRVPTSPAISQAAPVEMLPTPSPSAS